MAPDLDRPTRSVFDERLWPSIPAWCALLGLVGMLTATLVPVRVPLALLVGAIALVAGVVLVIRTTPRVEVGRDELRAGAAHIPLDLLGTASVLDRDQMRLELGPRLDARAYVCLRSWIRSGVRVEVADPQDPTPYWLVSTRRPHDLVAALGRVRGDAR